MHRFYVYAFIVTLALALASCQGMGKFLPGFGGGGIGAGGISKHASDLDDTKDREVWPMLGYDTANSRNAAVRYPGPGNPDIGLLWEVRLESNGTPRKIYSSPVVQVGREVIRWHEGLPVCNYWEDIFVVAENGELFGLDGWDSESGHRTEAFVFGVTDTGGAQTFVAASPASHGEFGTHDVIPGEPSGNYNTVVFCDGNRRLQFFASNGKDDGIKDPRWPDDEGLTELIIPPGSSNWFDIGGDYAASSVVLSYEAGMDYVFVGTYDGTNSEPGRLHRFKLLDEPPITLQSQWMSGGSAGVPLSIGSEDFNVESSIAFRVTDAGMDDECYVVGRSQENLNTARLFVHDNGANANGQELDHSHGFLWFDEVNPSQGRGAISSPVIDYCEDEHNEELVYLATPHIHDAAPDVRPGDADYAGDVIRQFRYSSDGELLVEESFFTMAELLNPAAGDIPEDCTYVAGTPALVEAGNAKGTLVIALNAELDGFGGWRLFAFDMENLPGGLPVKAYSILYETGRCDTSPAIDPDGNVWVAASDGLYLFTDFLNDSGPQGEDYMYCDFDGRLWSSPSIGYPGQHDIHHKVYVADDEGWVYAFADDVDALEPTDAWPLQGHDERHSYQSAFPGPLSAGSPSQGTFMGNGSWIHDNPVAEPVLSPRGAHVYVMNRSDTLSAMSTAHQIYCAWYAERYGGEYQPPGPVYNFSAPAVGPDGTVYAMHTDGYLQAYTDQGNSGVPNWDPIDSEHQPGFPIEGPTGNSYAAPVAIERGNDPVVSTVVYVGTWSGNICAVRDDGNSGAYWWSDQPPSSEVISVGAGCQIVGAPAVHPNGDIFFVALENIHEDLENLGHWLCDARVGFIEEQQVQPHVYYATHDAQKDEVIENLNYYRCMEMRPQPAISDSGRIVVAVPDWLHVYELVNGELVDIQDPATAPEAGYCFSSTPALDYLGNIYVAQTLQPDGYNPRPSFVCRYTADGIPQWAAPDRPTSDHEAFAAVTLDASSCLYWSTRQQVKAYDMAPLAPLFSAQYGTRHLTSAVIADDGTAFVANLDNTIFKIGSSGT